MDEEAYRKAFEESRSGIVTLDDFSKLFESETKIFWYHNLSDEALSPYISINMYKELAQRRGGYAKLGKQVRFFAVPGTFHCDIESEQPGNFDAIGALEAWVERDIAPNAIMARKNDPAAGKTVDWSTKPLRTIPICAFPGMARYKGSGDVNDAANWECIAGDMRMLAVGTSGLQAGAIR